MVPISAVPAPAWRDRARFYTISGGGRSVELPSVTTVLGVIDKSGPLMGWAVKKEREHFRLALLEVLTGQEAGNPDHVWSAVEEATKGVKKADREREQATTIGTAAHAAIEWRTRRLLGKDAGPEPVISDAASLAVMAWEDWAKDVQFTPVMAERTIYCAECGYAGTLDWIAHVRGIVTLGDYKTSKAIYPESFLQNVAYRHAAAQCGWPTAQGIVLRLPKTLEDPAFESMYVPETTSLTTFLHALALWRWQRQMDGKPTGEIGVGHAA